MSAELTDVTAAEGLRAKDSETQPRRASFARERSRLESAMKQSFVNPELPQSMTDEQPTPYSAEY